MSDGAPLLLDTHVWIWMVNGTSDRIGRAARARLEKASTHYALRVSVLSTWEVAMLEARGRLTLALDCRDWVARGLGAPGVVLEELTPEIAVESTRLPEADALRDPVDRMLVATARQRELTLVTADAAVLAYAKGGRLRVLDARR
ncbi:MAG: type II toxin-antitoxin system VapC family toxin [Vicinamibacterales bacterium]|nr:type II toxin-antitoxin system VapC family toxin [Vicinamibacterales bacterium]